MEVLLSIIKGIFSMVGVVLYAVLQGVMALLAAPFYMLEFFFGDWF